MVLQAYDSLAQVGISSASGDPSSRVLVESRLYPYIYIIKHTYSISEHSEDTVDMWYIGMQ